MTSTRSLLAQQVPLPIVTDDRLAARYDAAATDWHRRVARLGYRRAYAALVATLTATDLLPAQPATLDCGIGTALFTLGLTDVLGPLGDLAGVDASAAMVAQARGNLAAAGLSAAVRHADARALPFANGRFDLVISSHMLEHLTEPNLALREMRRVLRPTGQLLLVISRPGVLTRWFQRQWGHQAYQEAACLDMLRAAGFWPLSVLPLRHGMARFTSFAVLARRAEGH